jgi:hypothetical protein
MKLLITKQTNPIQTFYRMGFAHRMLCVLPAIMALAGIAAITSAAPATAIAAAAITA